MAGYTIERKERQCWVMLQGDLTAPLIPDLQAALKKNLEQGVDEAVFDLEKTGMLDSSGIGLLIAACNSLATKKGKMRVLNVSSDILRLLQSMRLVTRLNASGRELREETHG
jgi:anti-anti-sigma factor